MGFFVVVSSVFFFFFFFFCLTYVELKHQSDEPKQAGTNASRGLAGKF